MANSGMMIGGGCGLYCSVVCCCVMIGLFITMSTLGAFVEGLGEFSTIIEGGSALKVLVNSTDTYSSTCLAACKTIKEEVSKDTNQNLQETGYRCQKVSGTKSECPCETGKKFFIDSTTSFGTSAGVFAPSCLLVEHMVIDGKNTDFYAADQDAIFLPKNRGGITTDTLLVSWSKADATKQLKEWKDAVESIYWGIVACAIIAALSMLCCCIGGGLAMLKSNKRGPSSEYAGQPTVVGQAA